MDAPARTLWGETVCAQLERVFASQELDAAARHGVLARVARECCRDLIKRNRRALARRRRFVAGFERRLAQRWGRALDLFELALRLAQDAGGRYNAQHRSQAAAENNHVFEVLTRLHARACLTASEVLTLLRTGHATAAHAHWRTLHEIAVAAFFVESSGDDIAERYLLHNVVASYKAAQLYDRYADRLGLEPRTREEVDQLQHQYDAVRTRFGPTFTGEYGWAYPVFGRDPKFIDLEDRVGLDHWRPYYRMASHGVHAGPKGVLWSLQLVGERDVLLAGPSNARLADPGHGALIALNQASVALLKTPADLEDILTLAVLGRLVEAAGDAFLAAHERLEADEDALSRAK